MIKEAMEFIAKLAQASDEPNEPVIYEEGDGRKYLFQDEGGSVSARWQHRHLLDLAAEIVAGLDELPEGIERRADELVISPSAEQLLRAVEIDAGFRRRVCTEFLERDDDAERELKRALKVKPDDLEVLLQQGILACRRAKWREAVEPLSRVVRLDPHAGHAYFYLGEALSRFDRWPEALAAYERATHHRRPPGTVR